MQIISLENPLFRGYIFYSSILIFKVLYMSYFNVRVRRQKKVSTNPEDLNIIEGLVIKYDTRMLNEAHLNDLENIVPFFTIAFCYILTNPNLILTINLFRVFTVARYFHTFVYTIVVVPQPSRAICFMAAMGVNVFMALSIAYSFLL